MIHGREYYRIRIFCDNLHGNSPVPDVVIDNYCTIKDLKIKLSSIIRGPDYLIKLAYDRDELTDEKIINECLRDNDEIYLVIAPTWI